MFIYSEFIPVYFHSGLPGPPASGHTPGPVPSPQTPPAPDHPASVSGHTPETPETPVRSVRRTEARTWDEDSLCSPLTRAQRAQTRPGQSLPAGHTWATHSAAKSLSLGMTVPGPHSSKLSSLYRRLLQAVSRGWCRMSPVSAV